MAEALRVGIAGLGTVGASVARVLSRKGRRTDPPMRPRDRRDGGFGARPQARTAASISATCAMVRRSGRSSPRAHDIDVFVELIGGDEGAARASREGGARSRPPCRHRQQGAARQARRRAGRDRREEGRAAQLRGGGGRRHPGHQDDARGDGRQYGDARLRHPQRHLQLHPDPHGGGGPVVRRLPEGCAAARLCRGRSDLRHRGPRHGAQAVDPDQPRLRLPKISADDIYHGRHLQHHARPTSARPANSATASSCSASRSAPTAASSSACTRPWCRPRR